MKNPLHAFAPFMAIIAAYDGLYEGNLPAKVQSMMHKLVMSWKQS